MSEEKTIYTELLNLANIKGISNEISNILSGIEGVKYLNLEFLMDTYIFLIDPEIKKNINRETLNNNEKIKSIFSTGDIGRKDMSKLKSDILRYSYKISNEANLDINIEI